MHKKISKIQPVQVTVKKCPECGSTNLIHDYDTGETICGNCGLVIQDVMMDKGPEWRAFTQEEKESRSRVGIPTSYSVHDKGLSTSIDRIDKDAFGRRLPLATRLQMWRLRKWQIRSRVHSSIDRNLAQAMTELDRLSSKVTAPSAVKEKAAVIYRKALDEGLVRGRSIAAIAAASLYAACRITGTPRSLREIAEASLVDKKDIARCYRLLLRELDLHIPLADPMIYITKIARRADISGQVQAEAVKILKESKRKHVSSGKDPMGLAAAALYIACKRLGERKTQKEIADAAGVTEVTVRNRFKTLKSQLNISLAD
ncbi:transcription initiation factor IIB [Candidatus Bathyarchaeota archaeon]|nr:MAG: transcription initiation factor IIB [Candidatus Bathyarchaeota archaeon]